MESLREERKGLLAESRYGILDQSFTHPGPVALHPLRLRRRQRRSDQHAGPLVVARQIWPRPHPLVDRRDLPGDPEQLLWNNFWTFKATSVQSRRFAQFVVISLVGMVINLAILNVLVRLRHPLRPGNLAGIMVATAWNFFANSKWTWGEP